MSRRLVMPESFWAKVNKTDGCWLWTRAKGTGGYGNFWNDGAYRKAHRVAWAISNGPIPAGMDVCHRCDTPACVRPDHLFLGTAKDNMADCRSKKRHAAMPRGDLSYACKISDADIGACRFAHVAYGVSAKDLAAACGVARYTMRAILSGRHRPPLQLV